jgi:transcriptional regulator with XRE-family HTH domain
VRGVDMGHVIRAARHRARLTQAALAAAAGTSQPTIAAYETGRTEPTVSTLERLLAVCGLELSVRPVTSPLGWTRTAARSLALHQAVAAKLLTDPDAVIAKAYVNLAGMRVNDERGHARRWLDEWDRLLASPLDVLVTAVLARTSDAVDLRQMTPFAGVLSVDERAAALAAATGRGRRAS